MYDRLGPLRRTTRAPVTNITPFTYRDGSTYLEILMELIKYVSHIVKQLAGIVDESEKTNQRIDNLIVALDKQRAEDRAEVVKLIADLRRELLEEIAAVTVGGSAFDPTTGEYRNIDSVIGNVYDNVRVHAIFAADVNRDGLTAAEMDARGWSARHHDLSPLDPTNDEIRG